MAATLYDMLGVTRDCDFAALKKAYYARAKGCHPDRFGNAPAKTEEFKILVAAFNTLSDPERRRRYDLTLTVATIRPPAGDALLGSEADDILEELIVGNNAPPESSLATLMADLAKTEVFVTFREGRNHYAERRMRAAECCFYYVVGRSPGNILYRIYLARAHAARRRYRLAFYQYRTALELGRFRDPPLDMSRVRREYEALRRRKRPLLHAFLSLFRPPEALFCEDTAETMVRQLNSRIARELAATETPEPPKRLDR